MQVQSIVPSAVMSANSKHFIGMRICNQHHDANSSRFSLRTPMQHAWGVLKLLGTHTMLAHSRLLVLVLALCWSATSAGGAPVRGLRPDEADAFASRLVGGMFDCGDGALVPAEAVNDDYCDCDSGADEPGTSACPNSMFWCPNRMHIPRTVPSGWVNDGRCDCCDGSDEWSGAATCPNRCAILRRNLQMEEERIRREHASGVSQRQQMADAGAQKLREMENQLGDLRREAEALRVAGAESASKASDDVDEPRESEIDDVDEPGEYDDEYDEEYMDEWNAYEREDVEDVYTADEALPPPPAAGNGVPVAEESGAAPLSEYAQWMAAEETDAVPEGRARKLWRAATGAMTGAVDRAKKAAISMWRSTLPVARPPSRKASESKSASARALETKIQTIEEHARLREHGSEFVVLFESCYKKKVDQYEYEICFFKNASQIESGRPGTVLGKFKAIKFGPSGEFVMEFSGGARCWGGPERSIKVEVACGSSTDILSVSEPEKCTYQAHMTSPTACGPEPLLPARDEL
eukprot:Polyplicarium_translucidae@DN2999_c0_g1_i2.p1